MLKIIVNFSFRCENVLSWFKKDCCLLETHSEVFKNEICLGFALKFMVDLPWVDNYLSWVLGTCMIDRLISLFLYDLDFSIIKSKRITVFCFLAKYLNSPVWFSYMKAWSGIEHLSFISQLFALSVTYALSQTTLKLRGLK